MVRLFNEILGKEVDLPERPSRIVSFSPALTEGVFAIGLGESVVGVSAFCQRPPQVKEKRRVGSYNTVSYELLDELKPDLVLAVTGYQREFAVRLSQRYPIYPLELPVSVAGIVDAVVKLGLVTGAEEEARTVASRLLRKVGDVRPAGRSTVYVEIDLGGPVSFGALSYITDAIHLVGSRTLYDRARVEWLKPDLQEVADRDPDVIIFEPKMYSRFGEDDLRDLLTSRKWGGLRAVEGNRVFLTPGPNDFLAHHGPSFVDEALPWLQATLDAPTRT